LLPTCAAAERFTLICDPTPGSNSLSFHLTFDTASATVTRLFVEKDPTPVVSAVEITPDTLSWREDFMERLYVVDRKTQRMVMTAKENFSDKRFVAATFVCHAD